MSHRTLETPGTHIPPEITAERLAARLRALGGVRVEPARPFRRTLLDRADGVLRAHGVRLEWQSAPAGTGHRLAWRDGPRNPISVLLEPPAPRHAADLPPGLLRRRLLDSVGQGDLIEVASVEGSAQRVRLIDREEKTVCWLSVECAAAVDTGAGAGAGERRLRLERRVLVTPIRGYAAVAARIAAHLSEQPGWRESRETHFDEALRRMARGADSRIGTHIARLLRSMEKHRKAIDPAGDPEVLHDFWVCLRRARTLFSHIPPSRTSPPIAGELKWLGQVSGEARDLDVQAADLRRTLREQGARYRAVYPRIEALVEERRLEAHRRLATALASRRYARLLRRARDALGAEAPSSPRRGLGGGGGDAPPPALRAAEIYRKALRQGRRLGPQAPDEHFHRLRKTIKKLRYWLETRPAQGDGSRTDDGLESLRGMQTILGELNDLSVQRELLEGLKGGIEAGSEAAHDVESCLDALLAGAEARRHALKTAFTRHFDTLRAESTRRNLLGPDSEAESPS